MGGEVGEDRWVGVSLRRDDCEGTKCFGAVTRQRNTRRFEIGSDPDDKWRVVSKVRSHARFPGEFPEGRFEVALLFLRQRLKLLQPDYGDSDLSPAILEPLYPFAGLRWESVGFRRASIADSADPGQRLSWRATFLNGDREWRSMSDEADVPLSLPEL